MQGMLEKLVGESRELERAMAGEPSNHAGWNRIDEI